MGKGVHRQGDMTTGHGCWLPSQAVGCSGNVRVEGKGVVRQGDAILPHTCPSIPETHGGTYVGGGKVRVNGRPAQVIGSSTSCGDKAAEGSSKVRMGN